MYVAIDHVRERAERLAFYGHEETLKYTKVHEELRGRVRDSVSVNQNTMDHTLKAYTQILATIFSIFFFFANMLQALLPL